MSITAVPDPDGSVTTNASEPDNDELGSLFIVVVPPSNVAGPDWVNSELILALPPDTINVSSADCDTIVSPPSKVVEPDSDVEPDIITLLPVKNNPDRLLAILCKLDASDEPETANPKNPPWDISILIWEKSKELDTPELNKEPVSSIGNVCFTPSDILYGSIWNAS